MDVKACPLRLTSLFFILVSLSACGSKNNNDPGFTKADTVCSGASVAGEKIVRWKNGSMSLVKMKSNSSVALAAFVNKNQKDIAYIEDNFKIYAPQSKSVHTAGWGGDINWGPQYIKAQNLWDKNIFGAGVVVAVIDSGIDTQHDQLSTQLYTNTHESLNGLDDDGNGLIDDIHGFDFTSNSGELEDTTGHGTHVAGIIAANHNTGDIDGVAPEAKLLVYDFFTESGEGSIFNAIEAIRLAAQSGAKVINASWGGPSCSRSLNEAIDQLSSQDILFISAAGNEAQNLDLIPSYPAAYEAAAHITVAAMTADELTAGFSNFGNAVHLAAPGASILSTYPGNSTEFENGTSMAAPFVTGAAALLWSAFPQASARDIKAALTTAVHAGPYPVKSRGALDVSAAYESLKIKFP